MHERLNHGTEIFGTGGFGFLVWWNFSVPRASSILLRVTNPRFGPGAKFGLMPDCVGRVFLFFFWWFVMGGIL